MDSTSSWEEFSEDAWEGFAVPSFSLSSWEEFLEEAWEGFAVSF